jgi:uncharacterized protein (TIGR03437 family)
MSSRFLRAALVPLGFATLLQAAPMLRLVNTAVVPVPLPAGTNGGTQIVEAYNAGDGVLSLSNPSSSVSWIATSVGPPRACTTTTASATCTPLQLVLNTSALAAGTYTGSVTVNGAANVVDAPQTITVTVRIGALNAYVAPGSSSDVSFSTNSQIQGIATTQDGARWLSLAQNGTGSFRFTFPYNVHVAPPATMAQGTYNGSLVISGSSFAPDNQTIPVTMHVTTQPIAQASPAQVTARLALGAAPLAMQISLNNVGQGSLSLGTVTYTTTDGGKWLTASADSGGWANVTLDPGTLAPGFYTGSVSIASNAANGTVTAPVSFQVVAKGAPTAFYKGVVDNAIFGVDGGGVAPGDIVALFGEQLSFAGLSGASSVPLPTQLGGAIVLVNGRAAPLYSVSESPSYDQIDLQIPLETPVGTAQVQVQRDGLSGNTVSVQVVARAPRILVITRPDGSVPDGVHPARVGDTLIIWAIGLGPTNPAVGTNAPAPGAEPLARLVTMPTVEFGSGIFGTLMVTPDYAGLSPGSVGLYQVNAVVPQGVPSGQVNLTLLFPDSVSNTVQVALR